MERTVEYPDAGRIRVRSRPGGQSIGLRTTALGRNGTMNTRGLVIQAMPHTITLFPVTSRGRLGRCHIDVHLASLGDLIRQLNAIKREIRSESTRP